MTKPEASGRTLNTAPADFVAELTVAAYGVALRYAADSAWIDLELVGVVGKDLDVTAGRAAAYTAALNALALVRKQLGSLDRVSRVVRLGVYVATAPDFVEHPTVADAASEVLRDVFGEEAVSSRLVFGVARVPPRPLMRRLCRKPS